MGGGQEGGGHLVSGRYRLQEAIGRGATGTVWRARDELLDREVAVKEIRAAGLAHYPANLRGPAAQHQVAHAVSPARLRAPLEATPSLVARSSLLSPGAAAPSGSLTALSDGVHQRALREAKAAARLNHPGVVTVFDIVEEDSGPFIIMELVPARSLDRLIAEDGPLPPLQAARVGADLLSALACAHAAGVLHRDVKPGNVLVGPDERTVLTDFGIATFSGDPVLTQAGTVVGTPGFTAPERVGGGSATPASDLWSLGATLYTAVEGRGPFERPGGAAAISAGVISEDPPRAPSAGPLAGVIAALLRADPDQRPDAAEAARLLTDAAAEAAADPAYAVAIPVDACEPEGRASGAGGGYSDRDRPHPSLPAFTDLPDPPWLSAAAGPGAAGLVADGPAGPAAAWPGRRPRPRGGRRARVAMLAAAAVGVATATAGLVAWSASSRPGSSVPAPAANTGAAQAGVAPTGAAPPAGYRRHEVTAVSSGAVAGFAIAVPATWLMTRKGLATYLRPSAGSASIEVSLAPFTFLRPMREAASLQAQALAQDQYPGYRLLSMRARTLLGVPDAVWRFSWDQGGAGRIDVLKLLTTVTTPAGTQPYVFTVSAPPAGFPAATEIFRRALQTFQPVP
jgi:serine/threonine protein kinase